MAKIIRTADFVITHYGANIMCYSASEFDAQPLGRSTREDRSSQEEEYEAIAATMAIAAKIRDALKITEADERAPDKDARKVGAAAKKEDKEKGYAEKPKGEGRIEIEENNRKLEGHGKLHVTEEGNIRLGKNFTPAKLQENLAEVLERQRVNPTDSDEAGREDLEKGLSKDKGRDALIRLSEDTVQGIREIALALADTKAKREGSKEKAAEVNKLPTGGGCTAIVSPDRSMAEIFTGSGKSKDRGRSTTNQEAGIVQDEGIKKDTSPMKVRDANVGVTPNGDNELGLKVNEIVKSKEGKTETLDSLEATRAPSSQKAPEESKSSLVRGAAFKLGQGGKAEERLDTRKASRRGARKDQKPVSEEKYSLPELTNDEESDSESNESRAESMPRMTEDENSSSDEESEKGREPPGLISESEQTDEGDEEDRVKIPSKGKIQRTKTRGAY